MAVIDNVRAQFSVAQSRVLEQARVTRERVRTERERLIGSRGLGLGILGSGGNPHPTIMGRVRSKVQDVQARVKTRDMMILKRIRGTGGAATAAPAPVPVNPAAQVPPLTPSTRAAVGSGNGRMAGITTKPAIGGGEV